MKEQFFLEDLIPCLMHTHLKLDLNFLSKILKNASKSDTPWRDIKFCNYLNCPININKKSSLTVYGWFKGYRTIPLDKLVKIISLSNYSWSDVENNLISIKSGINHGEIKPLFPIKIDSKLGSICGHIMGDGSIEKQFHAVFFSNSDKALIKEFYNYMEDIFGVKGRIWLQDKPDYAHTKWLKRIFNMEEIIEGNNIGIFYPKICSDILYYLLGKFAEGFNKSVTSQINVASKEFKIGFVRGFFDDEGSVDVNSQMLRFHQDRKDILEDIRKILLEFEIESNPIRTYFKNGKNRYYFNITHLKNYSKFNNLIGCTSPKKSLNLLNLVKNIKASRKYKNFNDF